MAETKEKITTSKIIGELNQYKKNITTNINKYKIAQKYQ